MAKQAPPGTQSVLRAVRLLKALASGGKEMDLAELTAHGGLARTTTHRLLSALESEGLVGRNPASGAYRLGPAAIVLGTQAMRSNDLRAAAHPVLEELAGSTGETATLEVLAGDRMLILDEVIGRHLVGAQPSMGTAWAIHATSTGKALLAALGETALDEALPATLEAFTDRTLVDRADLARELEVSRRRGWAVSEEELADGFAAVAAPVYDAMGEPIAAISLNVPVGRLSRSRKRELGELVRDRAETVTRALGGRSEEAVAR